MIFRKVIVFDTANLEAESDFWANLLGGVVLKDDTWHSLIDDSGEWIMGFQFNPNHQKPEWPNGEQQQQIHLDLHTHIPAQLHDKVIELGGTLLQSASFEAAEGFQVYSDPAGHPFCIGWGQPSKDDVKKFVKSFMES